MGMIKASDVALSQVGVSESGGENCGIPAERYMRGDELAWCAGFALWCNANSDDVKVARTDAEYYRMRLVQNFEDEMKARGWWLPPTAEPQEGDFVFCQTRGESDPGKGRHMGIATAFKDGYVETVEGNSGNRVAQRRYKHGDSYITGYGRPA